MLKHCQSTILVPQQTGELNVNANIKVNGQELKRYLATTAINNHKNTNNLNGCITIQGEIEEILSDFKPFVFLRC